MTRWLFWLLVRAAVMAALNAVAIHDFATAAAFWGAFSLVHLASVMDDAIARRATARLELPR